MKVENYEIKREEQYGGKCYYVIQREGQQLQEWFIIKQLWCTYCSLTILNYEAIITGTLTELPFLAADNLTIHDSLQKIKACWRNHSTTMLGYCSSERRKIVHAELVIKLYYQIGYFFLKGMQVRMVEKEEIISCYSNCRQVTLFGNSDEKREDILSKLVRLKC